MTTTYNLTTAAQLTTVLDSLKSPDQAAYLQQYLTQQHFIPRGRSGLTVVVGTGQGDPPGATNVVPNISTGPSFFLQGTHELFLFDGAPGQTAYVSDAKGGNILADPGNITYTGPQHGSHGDTLIGGDGGTFTALGGNDLLLGGVGASTLIAGTGKDTMDGTGQTLMEGGSGKDSLYGGASAAAHDTLVAGLSKTSNDLMQTKYGDNTFYTGSGNDTIKTGSGMDTVYAAGSGNATVYGSTSGNTIIDELHATTDIASEKTKHGVTTITFNDGQKLVYSHATINFGVTPPPV